MKPILRDVLEGPMKSLFGGSSSSQTQTSTPQDMTPGEFTGLRPEVAAQLQNLFAQGGGQMFGGNMAAGLGGGEQDILSQLQGMTQPNATAQAGQNVLQQIMGSGVQMPGTPGQVQGLNPLGQLGELMDLQGVQGGTSMGQMNPFLQQAIEAAQRPLIDQYRDQIAPALRAQFTHAGQQIAGQGSSPFHMAAAREQSGMANALGDIGAQMSFQDFAQRQGLASQEFQQLRNLLTQQELTGRGQDLEHMLGGRQQDLAARGQDVDQRGQDIQAGQFRTQAELNQRQQQLDAVATASNIDRQQLDGLLANLEAQALPRLVEQLGIDRGLEEFRRREDQLMQALAMAAQVASPTVAQVSRGEFRSETRPNIFSSLFPGGFQAG